MLQQIFTYIIHTSLTACAVIPAVILVRILLHKAPKKYAYLLWAIVGIHLIFPIRLSSPISIYNAIPTVPAATVTQHTTSDIVVKQHKTTVVEQRSQRIPSSSTANSTQVRQHNHLSPITLVSYIWLCGCLTLLLWNLFLLWQTKRSVANAIRKKDNIYECDHLPTPFVLGIIKQRIYIPFHLTPEEQKYILMHEQYHIRRKDPWIKLGAFVLCILYWFHPLIWISYFCMIRDMEMSCDEYVLQNSTSDIRKAYSRSLLSFATRKQNLNAGLLAFGESNTRKRVKNIMKFTTQKKWIGVAATLIIVLAGVACLTNATKKTTAKTKTANTSSPAVTANASADKRTNSTEIQKNTNSDEDSSTMDETPISSTEISISSVPKSGQDEATIILQKIQNTFPNNVYREMVKNGKIKINKFAQGDITCSIINKNNDDSLYLDLFFDACGNLYSMTNQCQTKPSQKVGKSSAKRIVTDFAKTFLNAEVAYSDKAVKQDGASVVTIGKGTLPDRYQNADSLTAFTDNHANSYVLDTTTGMIISFYHD